MSCRVSQCLWQNAGIVKGIGGRVKSTWAGQELVTRFPVMGYVYYHSESEPRYHWVTFRRNIDEY